VRRRRGTHRPWRQRVPGRYHRRAPPTPRPWDRRSHPPARDGRFGANREAAVSPHVANRRSYSHRRRGHGGRHRGRPPHRSTAPDVAAATIGVAAAAATATAAAAITTVSSAAGGTMGVHRNHRHPLAAVAAPAGRRWRHRRSDIGGTAATAASVCWLWRSGKDGTRPSGNVCVGDVPLTAMIWPTTSRLLWSFFYRFR